MTNREKIIQELTYCLNEGKCTKCEYTEGRMFATCRHIAEEILALLKEQENDTNGEYNKETKKDNETKEMTKTNFALQMEILGYDTDGLLKGS